MKKLLILGLFGLIATFVFGQTPKAPPQAEPETTASATTEALPHYITPSGPTKVIKYGAVGCLTFENLLDVVGADMGWLPADVDGLINAGRCVAMPIGTPVEVVKRAPKQGGGELNSVCVKPAGSPGGSCVWTMIQYLNVRAD